MNIKKRLEHLAYMLTSERDTGSTPAIIKAAKDTDGVVLAADFEQVKYLKRKFNIESISIETNLEGIRGPFFMDHFAIGQLLLKAANKITEQEKELARFTEVLDRALVLLNDESLKRIVADVPNLLDRASPGKTDQ